MDLTNRFRAIVFLVAAFVLVGCDEPNKVADKASSPSTASTNATANSSENNNQEGIKLEVKKPGTYKESIVGPDESIIRYTLHIPESYDGSKEVPLVVTLHFGGRVTPHFGETILTRLVEPALRDLGAIMISPDSINGRWSTTENENAVVFLFEAIANTYKIDRKKTLITGFSLGGHGTWAIGGKHQDLFKAAIPIAGRPTELTEWTTPIYVIHSKKDTVVPFGPAEKHVEKLKAAGADVTLKVVEDLTHYQTPLFGQYLKQAVPWIREAWDK